MAMRPAMRALRMRLICSRKIAAARRPAKSFPKKRFVVLSTPEASGGAQRSVHVTMLLNFFDEVRRKLP